MIIIATHAVFLKNNDIHGPPHTVSEFLNKQKKEHLFIKHNLYTTNFSRIDYFKDGVLSSRKDIKYPNSKLLKYLFEAFITIKYSILFKKEILTFIGVDPINNLFGNILKLIGESKKTVYFSADFATIRFGNKFLDTIYKLLDKTAMFWSDQTWSVSQRIVDFRNSQGLPDKKNVHIPNAPFFDDIYREPVTKINFHDLVIVSAIEKGIDFFLLLDVIEDLVKKISDINLHIIGSGSREPELKKYATEKKIDNKIFFHGALSHHDMFRILTKCGLGIALYEKSPKSHFRYFSDPMKVRDYLASGLPVIISGNSGINFDIEKYGLGYTVDLDKNDILNKIKKIILDKNQHSQMRDRAIKYAKEHDIYSKIDLAIKSM